jgi:acyl-CoA thioesterase
MSESLDVVLDAEPGDDGLHRLLVPDGWQQGRGAFGGLVIGAMVRATARTTLDPGRSVRSVTAEIVAPVVPGPARIEVATWRRGSTMQGEVAARATVVLATDRPDAPTSTVAPPTAPRWTELPVVHAEPPLAPVFMRHFALRPCGPFPYSGSAEATTLGWVQARSRVARRLDAAHVAALADVLWPSHAVTWTTLRPLVTVAFVLDIMIDPATLDPDEPLLHRARCPAAARGMVVDDRELWTAGGVLVARNQQTYAILR